MAGRNGIIGALTILILLIAGWYFFAHRGPVLSYTLIEPGTRQHKEETDFLFIQVNYPDGTPLEERTGWRAETRAQKAIEDLLEEYIDSFKSLAEEGLTDEEQARLLENKRKYSLNIMYRPYSSGSFVSYEFDIYTDTGGAHPNTFFESLVLDLEGGRVLLRDLFRPGTPYLERISAAATAQVEQQLTERAGAGATTTISASGLAPEDENFENFVVDSDRLRIFIPPYQVAAYAAGSFEIQITLHELRDILREGIN